MEQQNDKFEQNPGATQGNIHHDLNRGHNEEGHAGSLEGKEPEKIKQDDEQKDGECTGEGDTVGIP